MFGRCMSVRGVTSRIFGAMTTKTGVDARRGRGRPQAFDRAEALTLAMHLFWERAASKARHSTS